jgi:RHS repeat-associated protein
MGGTLVSQLPFDLNGDGYSDLVYVVSTHGHYELRVSYNSLATLNGSMLLDTFNVRDNEDVKLIPLDIDGDGQMEIVYYHDYAGKNRWIYYDLNDATISKVQDDRTGIIFTSTDYIKELNLDTTQTGSDVMFHDVNADAYADMLYLHEGKNYIALNNTEGGFDTRKEVSVDLRLSSSQSLSTASTSSFTQSKTTGNNVMETLTLAEAFNKYKLIKPQQFAPVNEKVTVATTSADITSTEVDYFRNTDISALPSHLPPMDMNNDGVADLILRLVDIYDVIEGQVESNYFEYYWMAFQLLEENGEYRYEPIAEIPNSRTNGNSTLADNIFVNDINADGLADVVYRNDNNALAWNVHFGTGVGFTNGKALALTDYAGQALSADDVTAMQLLDINADGQSDIVYFNKDRKELRVLYRDGEAFTSPTVLYTFSAFNKDNDGVLLADWDGDGVLGFARSDFTNNKFYYHRDAVSLGRYPGNRIRTISNGFGIDTDIDYSVLTNSQVYQKGTGAKDLSFGNNSPVFDLIAPSYVVSHVTSDAPSSANAGATVTVMYQYEAMRAQAGGRGMLGFEKIRSYDIQTEVTTETLYHQDFPYIGMPKETRRYLGRYLDWDTLANNQKLSFARNTYNVKPLQGGKTQFPYLASSTETQYSLVDAGTSTTEISTVTTTNTYAVDVKDDNHANLTRVVVSTMDAAQTVASTVSTTNTYDGDNVDNWWLGRVTNTKVTHHRPAAFPAGRQTVNRESDFVYSTTTGMLEKEIIQPGDSDTENLTTLHCYDNLGNKIESITYAGLDNDPSCSAVSALHESSATLDEEDPSAVLRRSFTIFDTEERRYVNQRGNDKFIAGTVNTRNAFGQATNTTDINGVVSLAGYDSFGAQYASSNSLGMSSQTSRRLAADASTIVAPTITEAYYFVERTRAAGAPTSYAYFDKVGRQVAAVKQSFAANTWVYQYSRYDSYGRVVAQSVPSQSSAPSDWAYTDYDKFGRAQLITSADNTDSTVEYNGLTTTTKVTFDGGTQQSIDVKNILGETVFVSDNADGEIQYFYDATGNLTKVIGVDNVAVTTTFDDLGRKTQMVDPDKGTWNYTYNAAGELITQTSANLHKTTFYRDSVGRTTKRVVSGGSPAVSEITKYSFTAHRSKGECQQISSTNASCDSSKPSKAYGYDNVGRVIMLGTQLDGDIYYQSTTYDQYGRIFQQFDAEKDGLLGCVPSSVNGCWGIKYNYTSAGYLLSQEEARFSASAEYRKIYYQVDKMDALGNVTEFVQNAQDTENKTTTLKGYHQDTGYLATINVTNGQNQDVVNHIYTFDAIGNLRERDNISSGFTETFGYDELNRLLSSTGGPIEDIALTYAANGNILTKSDLQGGATYDYGVKESQCAADTRNVSAGAHAVTSVGTLSYCYDKNGNQTQAFKNGLKTRNIQYSHFDKPSLIDSNGSTAFSYDNGRNRYKRVTTENNLTTTTYYLGNLELISKSDGSSETRRYLPGAIETRQGNGNSTVRYLHKDHLGSIDTITNEAGEIVEKLYFDAWGNKHRLTVFNDWSLDAQNAKALTLTDVLDLTPRGFTGHEHVDHAGIIHMNGRIYDPTLGRFLQADPNIQAPKNSQSLNRYSYVLNNPLSYTDPSGYFFSGLKKFVKKYWKVAVAAVAAYFTFGYALTYLATTSTISVATAFGTTISSFTYATAGAYIGAGAAAGFVGGAIVSGSLKGALRGAFTGAVLGGVGWLNANSVNSFGEAARQVAIAGVGGCATGAGTGGSCREGAKLAAMAQSLKVGMELVSSYEPTWKSADGEGVVKLEGDGVENSSFSNVGKSIEVRKGSVGEYLVGRKLSSLTAQEAQLLIDTNPLNKGKLFVDGSSVTFGWDTEGSALFSGAANRILGTNSMAVFHDVWMARQGVTSAFYLGATIVPAAYVNYNALGLSYYDYLSRRIDD